MQIKLQNILIKVKYVQYMHMNTHRTNTHIHIPCHTHTQRHSCGSFFLCPTIVMPLPIVLNSHFLSLYLLLFYAENAITFSPRNRGIINYFPALQVPYTPRIFIIYTIYIFTYLNLRLFCSSFGCENVCRIRTGEWLKSNTALK